MTGKRNVDRRGFGRRSARCHAFVKAAGRPLIACVIVNISEGGALLAFDQSPQDLPNAFVLRIDAIGEERQCEVRHRHPRALGVLFAREIVLGETHNPVVDRGAIWGLVQEHRNVLRTPSER